MCSPCTVAETLCAKCQEPADLSDSYPPGRSTCSSRRIHHVCHNVQKALPSKMKRDARFKEWWSQCEEDEKSQYFVRQKRMKRFGKGIARQWNDTQVILYEQKRARFLHLSTQINPREIGPETCSHDACSNQPQWTCWNCGVLLCDDHAIRLPDVEGRARIPWCFACFGL